MTISPVARQTRRILLWSAYLFCCVWLAVAAVWWGLARADYAYPLWYRVLNIQDHIATYAAQNPEKPGFAQLPPEQHRRAFTQIRESVHGGSPKLGTIVYPGPTGQTVALLTNDEITHLRDVRRLFDRAALASALFGLLWFPLAWRLRRAGTPGRRQAIAVLAGAAVLVAGILILAGPTAVFYKFHDWLFPPEHPWFFYWQESLMSTLMKAPALFGGIAAMLVPAGLLLTPLLYLGGLRLSGRLERWITEHVRAH